MLLIRRSIIIILSAVTAVSIIIMAGAAYSIVCAAGEMDAETLRFQAEKILFAGIILTFVSSASFAFVIIRSRNIKKDLDKLVKQNRLNPAATKNGLLKLGATGQTLHELYRQIDEVSEKRGLKISALTKTSEFLSQNIAGAVLIADVTGRVIQASRGYLEQNGVSRSEIVDHELPYIGKGIRMKAILSRLEKKPLPVETETEDSICRWTALYNSDNEISYIAVTQLKTSQSDDSPN